MRDEFNQHCPASFTTIAPLAYDMVLRPPSSVARDPGNAWNKYTPSTSLSKSEHFTGRLATFSELWPAN
jgi:hypothetical protein